jgi:hypothetical protein
MVGWQSNGCVFTFTAAADAIDYSDDDNEESSQSEEVSDVSVAASSDNSDDGSDDDDDDSDDRDTEEAVFLCDARDIQNRTSLCVEMAAMEDRWFRSLFGGRIEIVLKVWSMLLEDGLHPKKSKPAFAIAVAVDVAFAVVSSLPL